MNNCKKIINSKINCIQLIVTLVLHGVLLLDAAASIVHYTDFFLGSELVLLIIYLIFILITSAKRKISIYLLILFYICTLCQIAVFGAGIIDLGNHPLGGGGFGAVFYLIGMVFFCIILGIIGFIKWIMMRGLASKKD